MNYIELKKGLCVRKDAIDMIEVVDEFTTRVHLSSGSYDVQFPYDTLKQLLEVTQAVSPTFVKLEPKVERMLSESTHHFAG